MSEWIVLTFQYLAFLAGVSAFLGASLWVSRKMKLWVFFVSYGVFMAGAAAALSVWLT